MRRAIITIKLIFHLDICLLEKLFLVSVDETPQKIVTVIRRVHTNVNLSSNFSCSSCPVLSSQATLLHSNKVRLTFATLICVDELRSDYGNDVVFAADKKSAA